MANQTRQRPTSGTGTASLDFDEFELNSTMQEFLKEEENETGKGIWNVATISGMVMLFMAITFVIQSIGLDLGGFGAFVSDIMGAGLPIIGGALITLLGFGFFVGEKKRGKKKKKKSHRKKYKASYNDIPGGESEFHSSNAGLRNDLDESETNSTSTDFNYNAYGYRHAKKLMKSRTNKKWAGVCGGLARYFGVSATVVRFIFVAAFFMSYGVVSIFAYIGLSIAMPKEPIEMLDDYDY